MSTEPGSGTKIFGKGLPRGRDLFANWMVQRHRCSWWVQWLIAPGIPTLVIFAALLVPSIVAHGAGTTLELMMASAAPSSVESRAAGYMAAVAGYLFVPLSLASFVAIATTRLMESRFPTHDQAEQAISDALKDIESHL